MNIPILQLQPMPDPPELVKEALSPQNLAKLGVRKLPALRLVSPNPDIKCGGWCNSGDYTEKQEVNIFFPFSTSSTWQKNSLRQVYVHETAHFLLQKYDEEKIGGGHGPVFFSLNLLLFLRAETDQYGHPWWWSMKLYDIQDIDFWTKNGRPMLKIGQAIDWAWGQAHELAPRKLSAEKCAEIIQKNYEKWLDWVDNAPARQAARQDRHQAAKESRQLLENALKIAKKNIWYFSCWAFMAGFVAAIMLVLLTK